MRWRTLRLWFLLNCVYFSPFFTFFPPLFILFYPFSTFSPLIFCPISLYILQSFISFPYLFYLLSIYIFFVFPFVFSYPLHSICSSPLFLLSLLYLPALQCTKFIYITSSVLSGFRVPLFPY